MKLNHSLLTNLRMLSVQAGILGGSTTALLAALQQNGIHVPAWSLAASGVLTALSVFGARLLPQPGVSVPAPPLVPPDPPHGSER